MNVDAPMTKSSCPELVVVSVRGDRIQELAGQLMQQGFPSIISTVEVKSIFDIGIAVTE